IGNIENTVRAVIEASPVGSSAAPVASLTVSATSPGEVISTAFAGAGGVTRSGGGGAIGFGLAAAVAVNTIHTTVEALVQGAMEVWSASGGSGAATDDSTHPV